MFSEAKRKVWRIPKSPSLWNLSIFLQIFCPSPSPPWFIWCWRWLCILKILDSWTEIAGSCSYSKLYKKNVTVSYIVQSFVFGLWFIDNCLIYVQVFIVHFIFPWVFFQHFFDLLFRELSNFVVINILCDQLIELIHGNCIFVSKSNHLQ